MLNSFIFQDQIINFVPLSIREGKGVNIFSADSMSLLVGANGAGKTELLAQLCKKFKDGEHVSIEADDALGEFGIVYFTPAPSTRRRFPRSSAKMQILDGADAAKAAEHTVMEELSRAFQFSPEMVVALRHPPERGLDALLASAMEIPVSIAVGAERALRPVLRRYQSASIAWRKAESGGGSNSERQREVMLAQRQLKIAIRRYLSNIYGEERANILLSSLAVALNERRKRPELIREFWQSLDEDLAGVAGIVPAIALIEEIFLNFGSRVARAGSRVDANQIASIPQRHMGLLRVEIEGLSSGAEALARQFFELELAMNKVARAGAKRLLLLIDEGDAFLHLAWQQKYVNFLDKFISARRAAFTSVQVVLATHSPVLMSDFPRDYVISVGSAGRSIGACFGAPLEMIIEGTAGAGTVGEFASNIMKDLVRKGGSANEYLVSQVDDPIVSSYLKGIRQK